MLLKARLPFDLWLHTCFGRTIPPEVIGCVISILQDKLYPKDPILPPAELFPYPGMNDFNEWSLYHGWMEQYLKYVHWYAKVALQPDVTLGQLFDAPLYIRTWFIPNEDSSSFRYGFMFRIYDLVADRIDNPPRLLPEQNLSQEESTSPFHLSLGVTSLDKSLSDHKS